MATPLFLLNHRLKVLEGSLHYSWNSQHIEGFRPERYISTVYHARDTLLWLGTLDMYNHHTKMNRKHHVNSIYGLFNKVTIHFLFLFVDTCHFSNPPSPARWKSNKSRAFCIISQTMWLHLLHGLLGVLYACVLYFCICTCSAQLSMFHMERRSRNTITTITLLYRCTCWVLCCTVAVTASPPAWRVLGSHRRR